MMIVGLDIGGANLKLADSEGRAVNRAFPLWKMPEQLAPALAQMLADYPPIAGVVVTMTGELADCFASKREGVAFIVNAAAKAAAPRPIRFYQVNGQWVDAERAIAQFRRTAASNWYALAAFVARRNPCESGLLIDVGSTTCDIIPFSRQGVLARGQTDTERLASGELLYTGVERSPVCAVLTDVQLQDRTIPLAQELFATMADVYVVLGETAESEEDRNTADGRPRTRSASHSRLARMVCADSEELPWENVVEIARQARRAQVERLAAVIGRAAQRRQPPCDQVVLSGHGGQLAEDALRRAGLELEPVRLVDGLGDPLSRVAPAYALVCLAQDAQDCGLWRQSAPVDRAEDGRPA